MVELGSMPRPFVFNPCCMTRMSRMNRTVKIGCVKPVEDINFRGCHEFRKNVSRFLNHCVQWVSALLFTKNSPQLTASLKGVGRERQQESNWSSRPPHSSDFPGTGISRSHILVDHALECWRKTSKLPFCLFIPSLVPQILKE